MNRQNRFALNDNSGGHGLSELSRCFIGGLCLLLAITALTTAAWTAPNNGNSAAYGYVDPAVQYGEARFPGTQLRITSRMSPHFLPTRHLNALTALEAPARSKSSAAALLALPAGWTATPPVEFIPSTLRTANQLGISPMSGNASAPFSPAQIRGAYGLNSLSLTNSTGAGVTVAIVDAYGDTSSTLTDQIQGDLQSFCSLYGLPYSAPDSSTPTLTEAFPAGTPTSSDPNWAIETALDVEWVHAMAPAAQIVLVVAPDNGGSLYNAVQYASANASIVSMSWGGPEFNGELAYDVAYFSTPGVAYFASSGDWGAGTIYPSVSPNVTSVGGTSLAIDSNNNWVSETAWTDSGGGLSADEPYAPFQSPWVASGNRQMPDISADADPNTGVSVVQGGQGWQVGGTSLSAPLWAGMTAVLDGNLTHPIGEAQLHSALYLFGNPANINTNFHDILSGSNGQYSAGPGYDKVTGIGSPLTNALLTSIVTMIAGPQPVITSPSAASGNVGSTFTYQIVATNLPTSYSALGLPAGLSVNPTTGLIFGMPSAQGVSGITIKAVNPSGTGTLALTLTVGGPLPPPTITSPSTATATVGQLFIYQITGTNSPTAFNATVLPASIYVNPSTGQVYGYPVYPGVFNVTMSASDYGGTNSAPLTLTVKPAVPVILGATQASAVLGVPFAYQITAANSPTSYSVAGTLPPGISVNTTTGVLSGTPTSAGVYTVTLGAANVSGAGSLSFALPVAGAAPAPITVTTTNDSGAGSLRAAISAANTVPGTTILFQSGLSGTITLASGLPPILTDMTIDGPGSANLAVDGAGLYRIFQCGDGYAAGQYPTGTTDGGTVTVSGLTVQNGSDQGDNRGGAGILVTSSANLLLSNCAVVNSTSPKFVGGGLSNAGVMAITGCTVSNNSSTTQAGGGIANEGAVSLFNTTLSENSSPGGPAGGIWSDSTNIGGYHAPILTLTDCVLSGNTASLSVGDGGAIEDFGFTTLTGCTLSGNSAAFGGGMIEWNTAQVGSSAFLGNSAAQSGGGFQSGGVGTVSDCTFSGNSSIDGSAIDGYQYGPSLTVQQSTISGNTTTNSVVSSGAVFLEAFYGQSTADFVGDIIYGNIAQNSGATVEDDLSWQGSFPIITQTYSDIYAGFVGTGNFSALPFLAPLGNYGGPTVTFPLLPGSPCLGAGTGGGASTDQRGVARPQGGRYDMGAFESQGFTVTPTSGNGQTAPVNSAFTAPISVAVTPIAPLDPTTGGQISFTAPATGASALLSGSVIPIGSGGTASITASANGTAGSYSVIANTLAGAAPFSLTNGSSVPPAPTGLTAAAGNAQVALNWTASSGATSYNVYRSKVSGGEGSTPIVTGITATTYTSTGLTNGTQYYFKVAAVNAAGTSPQTGEVSARPQVPAPAAPTGLTAVAGNAQVLISWTASSGAISYNLYRSKTAGGEGSTPIANGITGTTYTNSGLSNGTQYYFKVAAVNAGGTSPQSNEATAKPQVPVPPAPTGLTTTAGNAQAALSWTASSGATSYSVYRSTTAGGEGATAIATGITTTKYTNTGLTNGTSYYFKVAAVNGGGTSPQSNEASATPLLPAPGAPTSLTATAGTGQVALSWSASSGAASYNVYRSTSPGGEGTSPIATGLTSTKYINTGLSHGTQYYFKVAAVNTSGASPQSNEASAKP